MLARNVFTNGTRYTTTSAGVRGQSLRVIQNGGLSPLRNDRKALETCMDIRRLSAGLNGLGSDGISTLSTQRKSVLSPRPFTDSSQSLVASILSKRSMSTNKTYTVHDNGLHKADVLDSSNGHAPLYRTQLNDAKRIVIKLGSAVITRQDGGNGLALGRLAAIVEQISELQNSGRECVLITSGAVEYGKQKLSNELLMSMSLKESIQTSGSRNQISDVMKDKSFTKPNAAVGQSGLQALYETMFRNYGIVVGQVLVNKQDLINPSTRDTLLATMNELLALGIIPIINTNDAVNTAPGIVETTPSAEKDALPISDNDTLAANLAVAIGAHLTILMSDVDGIYDKPPHKTKGNTWPRLMHTFNPEDLERIEFGEKSNVGTGGMESKTKAAIWALKRGSPSIICNGMEHNTIRKVFDGQKVGTFFTTADRDVTPVEVLARDARRGGRKLQALSSDDRAEIIHGIAKALTHNKSEILEHNHLDLVMAKGLSGPMYDRLILTENKLHSLSEGLSQIADNSHNNLGRVVRRTRISNTIDLVQKTVPIGVLMVIFESRPDCLPQVASLAIASGNGLLMKGGKEASNTNECLMSLVKRELHRFSCKDAISLVNSREAISDLLKMDQMVDLVIPRGSSELVRTIKEQSRMIPVLGHAEGVCHTYVDVDADPDKAIKIVLDAKLDYPAACNAMETLLLHEDLLSKSYGSSGLSVFEQICAMLKKGGVEIFSGPKLQERLTFGPSPAESLRHEYGDKACTIELVRDVHGAMDHIHSYGSSHTDVIVSENDDHVRIFLEGTDSACTFANISSRIADGYRMGLGAEVGISTGRIHARGPVGVEGLMTTKWVVTGDGDTAQDYATGARTFLHEQLPVEEPKFRYEEKSQNEEKIQMAMEE